MFLGHPSIPSWNVQERMDGTFFCLDEQRNKFFCWHLSVWVVSLRTTKEIFGLPKGTFALFLYYPAFSVRWSFGCFVAFFFFSGFSILWRTVRKKKFSSSEREFTRSPLRQSGKKQVSFNLLRLKLKKEEVVVCILFR